MTTALHGLTAEAFGRKLRTGEVSAREVTEACLERIEADNPRFNAFVLVMADEAREQAHQADRELAAGLDQGSARRARYTDHGRVARAPWTPHRRARCARRRPPAAGGRHFHRQDQ